MPNHTLRPYKPANARSMGCFDTAWFDTLPDALEHARQFPRSYTKAEPARIGWVKGHNDGVVRWYYIPRGSGAPEGFALSLLLPEVI